MTLDIESRLSFSLKFKNDKFKIIADPIMNKVGKELRYIGLYFVEVKDNNNRHHSIIFKLSNTTAEWTSAFSSDLHPDVLKYIGYQITSLTE